MTQEEIADSNQNVAVTSKATRPLVFDQPAAPREQTERKITLAAPTEYVSTEFLTPLVPKEYWHVNFPVWNNTMGQARTYCRIYSSDLFTEKMDNISLTVCKYICFMSTLADYTDYALKESEIITNGLYPPLDDITNCIPWLVQEWPEMQPYLLTGNIQLMDKAPLEAPLSSDVTLEPESSKT